MKTLSPELDFGLAAVGDGASAQAATDGEHPRRLGVHYPAGISRAEADMSIRARLARDPQPVARIDDLGARAAAEPDRVVRTRCRTPSAGRVTDLGWIGPGRHAAVGVGAEGRSAGVGRRRGWARTCAAHGRRT